MTNETIERLVRENEPFFREVRHHIHRHPELSGQEKGTAAYIRHFLREWGIPFQTDDVSSTVAFIDGGHYGKTIAIRGDIDALPITEETGCAYASEVPGVMHACGHDCHAAFMLGAAKLLWEMREEIKGTVLVIFQEAEETGVGADSLMKSGLLANVDCIAALHTTQEYDLGKFALNYGVRSAFGAGEAVTVRTKSGQNALEVLAQIVQAVSAAAAKSFDPESANVLAPTMVKTIREEGEIPVEASVYYNFRSHDIHGFDRLHALFDGLVPPLAKAFGAEAEVFHDGYDDAVINDRQATDLALKVLKEHFGEESILITGPRMSGEDFAQYQKEIPGVFIHIGGAVNGEYRVLHTSKTMVDDGVLPLGIRFLLCYIREFLES